MNTAGFNRPFDELLPLFSKSNTDDVSELYEILTDVTSKLNMHMDKINVFFFFIKFFNKQLFFLNKMNHDLIDIKIKEISFKYEFLNNFIMKNPIHQQKFMKFAASIQYSSMNLMGSEDPVLTFNDLSLVDVIKEILDKERSDSQQSCFSIQSPVSAARDHSKRRKKETTIVEINDMIKQLSKKKNLRTENEESPKIKPNKVRGTMQKTTILSNLKKIDDLEIIQESEENKENIIGLNKSHDKFEKQSSRKLKKIPTFKMETNEHMEKTEEEEEEKDETKVDTEIHRSPNLSKFKSQPGLLKRISSKHEETDYEKKKERDEPNESNFSVNFLSQMPANMPFNMSVNVNTNPIFNLSSNMNANNFPFTINVESKKITESPIYPENNILESKTNSFKMDDSSYKEKSNENNENKDNKDNKNNKDNNKNNKEKKDCKENKESSDCKECKECKESKENNNLFRQRKIVIEHSMLITESIIEGSPVRQFTNSSNKGSGNLPKIGSNKVIADHGDNAKNQGGLANVD